MEAKVEKIQESRALGESMEDYLEIIFKLVSERQVARVRDIARMKKVKTASVSNALKRLSEAALIDYRTREYVQLTDEGKKLAHRIIQRHVFLKRFLTEILQVTPETAERDACTIEHQLSLETLDNMAAFYEFLTSCPHRDQTQLERFKNCCGLSFEPEHRHCPFSPKELCPVRNREQAKKVLHAGEQVLTMLDLKPGEQGQVIRLRARSEIRQRLIDMGVLPGVEVVMDQPAPLGDPVRVRLKGYQLSLRREEAAAIHVVKHAD
jgi:DtxR family Mn-dependent transcriptional regulator